MAQYSQDFKETMVRKMMPPNNQTVSQLARESGIPYNTLYTWRQHYQKKGFVVPAKNSPANQWDAKTKFAVIIQTASMNQAELAEYCRENNLYAEQIDEWKADITAALEPSKPIRVRELTVERKKVRRLEKELERKNLALAETAALLTLSKKVEAIWGSSGED